MNRKTDQAIYRQSSFEDSAISSIEEKSPANHLPRHKELDDDDID